MPQSKRLQNKPQSPRRAAPTLRDVSLHAGVSTATVSRFLTDPTLVRAERRDRIAAAIAEIGYIPHGAAQALASQRSRTIGAIVPTLDNAIFAKGMQAFQQRLQDVGYTLFISSSNYSLDEEQTQAEKLIARGVDGLMLVGLNHREKLFARLRDMQIPYVNTWSFEASARHPCVGFDNAEAARRLTSYLLDIGHVRFGIIAGITKDNDRARDRLDGTLRCLAERAITPPAGMVHECPYDIAESRQAMKRLLAAEAPPSAVICGNDVLAYGAMLEAQSCGVRIPGDLSIVGFDDLPMSRHLLPPLTTMRVPSEDMGRAAADYLLACLGGEAAPMQTEVEVNLIVRGSAAPPSQTGLPARRGAT